MFFSPPLFSLKHRWNRRRFAHKSFQSNMNYYNIIIVDSNSFNSIILILQSDDSEVSHWINLWNYISANRPDEVNKTDIYSIFSILFAYLYDCYDYYYFIIHIQKQTQRTFYENDENHQIIFGSFIFNESLSFQLFSSICSLHYAVRFTC